MISAVRSGNWRYPLFPEYLAHRRNIQVTQSQLKRHFVDFTGGGDKQHRHTQFVGGAQGVGKVFVHPADREVDILEIAIDHARASPFTIGTRRRAEFNASKTGSMLEPGAFRKGHALAQSQQMDRRLQVVDQVVECAEPGGPK